MQLLVAPVAGQVHPVAHAATALLPDPLEVQAKPLVHVVVAVPALVQVVPPVQVFPKTLVFIKPPQTDCAH